MHFAFVLCLALTTPGVAERFHRHDKVDDIVGRRSISVPDLDDVKEWAAFFASKEGGDLSYRNARDKALGILKDVHPDLDEVKKWAAFFASKEGGDLSYRNARDKALGILKDVHPDLDEVKKWAAFFASKEGGDLSYRNARDKALEMAPPSKKPAASDQSSPSSPTKPEPEPEPTTPTTTPTTTSKMLDCDAPASPKNGDPFGKICEEGVAQGGKLRHGQHCSPKCRLGHAPQPPSLTCDNGVIGSFECPEYIDPLQLACKEKCSAEGKGYKYQMKGGQPSCECLAAGDVFKLPF